MDTKETPSLSVAQEKDDGALPLPPAAQTPEKPAKKPTRQWAAWTRQEEESFFSALRQVGKNFEKITSRVQSKNKDQVRHYYYRLVRRMKKLLGPEFGLDAKNSKDTIAAMLRWWSLLEKHSCTASKLHLKPRRFKTFIEALAHQLLKDRNKTKRKRSTNGETFLPATPATNGVHGRGLGNDARPVKLFLVDGQNNKKVGSKGTCVGTNDSYSRGGVTNLKTMKQRRKSGLVASTAYKRWEKAAMAGVSLVADAAECLERSSNVESSSYDQLTCNVISGNYIDTNVQVDRSRAGIATQPKPSVNLCENHRQTIVNTQPLSKLKLQLFPLDDFTRQTLEKDAYNPFLELALSSRKKIASVIDHLNRKWGRSSIASGELNLFPYSTNLEDVSYSQRWTQKDTSVSAAEIFITIGSPLIFRLRYAWLSNTDSSTFQVHAACVHLNNHIEANDQVRTAVNTSNGEPEEVDRRKIDSPITVAETVALPTDNVIPVFPSSEEPIGLSMFPQDTVSPDTPREMDSGRRQQGYKAKSHASHNSMLSAGEWADSLTNISVGELLSEASREAHSFCNDPVDNAVQLLPKMPLSCDSFDAVIAAHLDGFRNQENPLPSDSQRSIWDAEETCDGFSFPMIGSRGAAGTGISAMTGSFRHAIGANSSSYPGVLENLEVPTDGNQCDREEELKDIPQSIDEHTCGSNLGLADISWPDSLSAFDLDVPSSRYVSQDLLFGDCNSL